MWWMSGFEGRRDRQLTSWEYLLVVPLRGQKLERGWHNHQFGFSILLSRTAKRPQIEGLMGKRGREGSEGCASSYLARKLDTAPTRRYCISQPPLRSRQPACRGVNFFLTEHVSLLTLMLSTALWWAQDRKKEGWRKREGEGKGKMERGERWARWRERERPIVTRFCYWIFAAKSPCIFVCKVNKIGWHCCTNVSRYPPSPALLKTGRNWLLVQASLGLRTRLAWMQSAAQRSDQAGAPTCSKRRKSVLNGKGPVLAPVTWELCSITTAGSVLRSEC